MKNQRELLGLLKWVRRARPFGRAFSVGALIVLGLMLSAASAARAQTAMVNVNCDRGQTIARALQMRAGVPLPLTITVKGTCEENVTVTRDDVALIGHASGGTVNGVNPSDPAITVNADRVTIDGLEVTGGRRGIFADGAGKLTIRNCNVHNTGGNGIHIGGGSKATIDNCTVHDNARNGITALGGSMTVINSTISSNTGAGIVVSTGGMGLIGVNDAFDAAPGNMIQNNGAAGITVVNGGTATIVANTVSGNGTDPAQPRVGINLTNASAMITGGNNITGNAGNGVSLGSSSVVIGGNVGDLVLPVATISGNGTAVAGSAGVNGFNGASISITQTTISGTMNGGRGINLGLLSRLVTSGSGVQVINNASDGILLGAGSVASFGTPAASVTGNGGFGLNCSGTETSFQGDTTGIVGNAAAQISANCSGF